MKRMLLIASLISSTTLVSISCCRHVDQSVQARKEILLTEQDFCDMTREQGIQAAFSHFAADSGIVKRGEKLIMGKEAIRDHYGKSTLKNVKLEWKPDYVDASSGGDLGYTYGRYSFNAVDSSGNVIAETGIFHTVWKRQKNGSWRFVWD